MALPLTERLIERVAGAGEEERKWIDLHASKASSQTLVYSRYGLAQLPHPVGPGGSEQGKISQQVIRSRNWF